MLRQRHSSDLLTDDDWSGVGEKRATQLPPPSPCSVALARLGPEAWKDWKDDVERCSTAAVTETDDVSMLEVLHSGVCVEERGVADALQMLEDDETEGRVRRVSLGVVHVDYTHGGMIGDSYEAPALGRLCREDVMRVGKVFSRLLASDGTLLVFAGTFFSVDSLREVQQWILGGSSGSEGKPELRLLPHDFQLITTCPRSEPSDSHRSGAEVSPSLPFSFTSEYVLGFCKGDSHRFSCEGNPHGWTAEDSLHVSPACGRSESFPEPPGSTESYGRLRRLQKPLQYMMTLLLTFSPVAGFVVELNAGLGTTALAAVLTGRRYSGFDGNHEAVYCALARLAALRMQLGVIEWPLKPAYSWSLYAQNYWRSDSGEKETVECMRHAQALPFLSCIMRAMPSVADLQISRNDEDWKRVEGRLQRFTGELDKGRARTSEEVSTRPRRKRRQKNT
jgi:hypothetical protein